MKTPEMDKHFSLAQRSHLEHILMSPLCVISAELQMLARLVKLDDAPLRDLAIRRRCQLALEAVAELERRVRTLEIDDECLNPSPAH